MSCEINESGFDSCSSTLRISPETARKYNFRSGVVVDELTCGLLLRPRIPQKLGWEETGRDIAAGAAEFSRWQDIDDGEYVHTLPVKRLDIFQALVAPSQHTCDGAEIPVMILSNDILNDSMPTVMACPLTANLHPQWRCRVGVVCGGREMEIAVEQMRMIHKSRLLYKIDSAGVQIARDIAVAMSHMYCEGEMLLRHQIKFCDVLLLSDRDVQTVLREVAHPVLTTALKDSSEKIRYLFFRNMSERAEAMIRQDMEDAGPVRMCDIEEARMDICKVMRSLSDEGVIHFMASAEWESQPQEDPCGETSLGTCSTGGD